MWDTRNFKGGMWDENMTARPGYALFVGGIRDRTGICAIIS